MLANQTKKEWGVLTCPRSSGALQLIEQDLVCTDPACRLQFAIEQGVPNLLVEEANALDEPTWTARLASEVEIPVASDSLVKDRRDQGEYDRKDRYDRLGDTYENDRYGERHMRAYLNRRTTVLKKLVTDELENRPTLQLLEVGCGTGVNLVPLLRDGVEAYALDISETMLRQAADRFSDLPNVRAIKGSAFGLPFADDTLDMVYATRFIHQFPADEKASIYQELYRVVRPGGLVVVEFYSTSIANLFTKRSKSRAFRKGIKFPRMREVRNVVDRPFRMIPLKINGTNFLSKFMGQGGLDCAVSFFGAMRILRLVSAYFVVSRA